MQTNLMLIHLFKNLIVWVGFRACRNNVEPETTGNNCPGCYSFKSQCLIGHKTKCRPNVM